MISTIIVIICHIDIIFNKILKFLIEKKIKILKKCHRKPLEH